MGSGLGSAGRARRHAIAAGVLALVAGLRVAAFAGAFPFFSNVDEHRHIDAVLKYSRGYASAPGNDAYESEMPTWLGMYGSPEYHTRPEAGAAKIPAPPWKGSMERTLSMIAYNERFLANRPNLEAFSPPVYYATAGAWMALGRALGLEGGVLLYWVRALSALLWGAVVFASWFFCRRAAPDDSFGQFGLPLLLTVFPQDALYYVTPDALTPALGALAWFGAAAWLREPDRPAWLYAITGIAAAAAFLTKYTGAVALAGCALATLIVVSRGLDRTRAAKLAWLWACALVPIALWLGRNAAVHGDWLATGVKLERLGWGVNSPGAYFAHPLWSPSGVWIFANEFLATFWRGELAWFRKTLVSPFADGFYIASSLLFLAAAAWVYLRRSREAADTLAWGTLAAGVGVLALLSMRFVFGETTNPTADNPYLSQGRLVAAALVPFAWLYVRGIRAASDFAPAPARDSLAWGLLFCAIGVVVGSELALSGGVFASPYNWFHFP